MHVYQPKDFGFGKVFWKSPAAVLVLDVESENVILWNPAAEMLLEAPCTEGAILPLAALSPGGLGNQAEGKFYADLWRSEITRARSDASLRHLELMCRPLEESDIPGFFVLMYARDITEQKQTERQLTARATELEEANSRLQELDRLKGTFINMACHELRTPLTSIAGYAEFLEDELAGVLSSAQREYVGQIQEGARRLSSIIDDLLDFARLEAGSFHLSAQDADLTALIRDEIAILRPQLKAARHELSLSLPEDAVYIRMDPKRIGQVLLNLIGNAIKFTPPGGKLEVEMEARASTVRIVVRDSGIGIAAANQGRLFDKFFQVDPSMTREYGGAGLGLAISKALVEAHDGIIGMDSQPGRGTSFWFSLPIQGAASLKQRLTRD